MSEYGDSFLLGPFREFYAEVISLKQLVSAGAWVSPATEASAPATPDDKLVEVGTWVYFPDVIAEAEADDVATITAQTWTTQESTTALTRVENVGKAAALDVTGQSQPSDTLRLSTHVWQRLVSLFRRQALDAWRYGGTYGAEFYKEAQYVMVALADEIFLLHTEWEGKNAWLSNLLESRIFNKHVAGELFFDNLDRILREQNPVYKDLAAVYLMALSLGFKGKYYKTDDRGQIARYRRQLFTFICRRDPALDNEARHMFPEAYSRNVREESQRKLADPRIWILLLCLVVIVYVVATQLLWSQLTQDLNTVNQSITRVINDLKGQP
ncbi:MAG TPA: DotU family type IV/VI secretion system protein [Pyrinomonadaceae bacterium]|nr:DotU family type IV/VI secretion system protein [Pyrinomonadaceae bacterium]